MVRTRKKIFVSTNLTVGKKEYNNPNHKFAILTIKKTKTKTVITVNRIGPYDVDKVEWRNGMIPTGKKVIYSKLVKVGSTMNEGINLVDKTETVSYRPSR